MDESTFWRLIDESRAASDPQSLDEADWQPGVLQRLLEALPPDDIAQFDRIFRTLHLRAYRHELWAAAYIIEGGCSDDGFTDFRSGLIGLGRDAYYDALRDPNTLARQPTRGVDFSQEGLLYAAMLAYEAVTGDDWPDPEITEPEPVTVRDWNGATVRAKYPVLAAKFKAP